MIATGSMAKSLGILAAGLLLWPVGLRADVLISETFESAALGRPLAYSLYLPPGFEAEPAEPYPLLVLLHGLGGSERDWPKLGRIAETADRLIVGGEIAPFLAAMPAGGSAWYLDSAAAGGPGDYASAIGEELRGHLEASLPVRRDRDGGAVAGLSMGGFGALRFAFEDPARYAAVGAFSPALWWHDGPALPPRQKGHIERAFGRAFPEDFFVARRPWAYLDRLAAAPERPLVYLSTSDEDGYDTLRYAYDLFRALEARGVPAELRVTDGDHVWPVWRAALADFLGFLGRELWPTETAETDETAIAEGEEAVAEP